MKMSVQSNFIFSTSEIHYVCDCLGFFAALPTQYPDVQKRPETIRCTCEGFLMREEGKNKMNTIKITLKIGAENPLMSRLRALVTRPIAVARPPLFILFETSER